MAEMPLPTRIARRCVTMGRCGWGTVLTPRRGLQTGWGLTSAARLFTPVVLVVLAYERGGAGLLAGTSAALAVVGAVMSAVVGRLGTAAISAASSDGSPGDQPRPSRSRPSAQWRSGPCSSCWRSVSSPAAALRVPTAPGGDAALARAHAEGARRGQRRVDRHRERRLARRTGAGGRRPAPPFARRGAGDRSSLPRARPAAPCPGSSCRLRTGTAASSLRERGRMPLGSACSPASFAGAGLRSSRSLRRSREVPSPCCSSSSSSTTWRSATMSSAGCGPRSGRRPGWCRVGGAGPARVPARAQFRLRSRVVGCRSGSAVDRWHTVVRGPRDGRHRDRQRARGCGMPLSVARLAPRGMSAQALGAIEIVACAGMATGAALAPRSSGSSTCRPPCSLSASPSWCSPCSTYGRSTRWTAQRTSQATTDLLTDVVIFEPLPVVIVEHLASLSRSTSTGPVTSSCARARTATRCTSSGRGRPG